MSSFIKYRKEFEDIILHGKLEEVLKTLVPNSNEYIYLQFCEEYKKCFSEKTISAKLNNLIKKAISNNISDDLIVLLETKRDLLEYDLPSTSQEKKNKIIDKLYQNYCGEKLNYDAPFFARVKEDKNSNNNESKDYVPLLLTEEMINNEIEIFMTDKYRNKKYRINNTPINKRHKLFIEYIKKDHDLCIDILNNNVKIPFYLMKNDEFSKVIQLFNTLNKNLSYFDYSSMTIKQIFRILNEVNNNMYINIKEIVSSLMKKKYNKLLKKYKKRNDLEEVKKILYEIYDIYKKYCPEYVPGILLYILKVNKQKNIYEIKPFLEYLNNPITDIYFNEQYKCYIKEIINKSYNSLIYLDNINYNEIIRHKFIEDLLIDFLVFDKAKIDDFNKYFTYDYLQKIEYYVKLYKGEEIKFDNLKDYLTYNEYEEISKKTEISICEHNPKEFKVNEIPKIDIDFKNIKSINLSIYEINTENYYLEKKAPLNSLINIEGIIASITMDIKIEGGENPFRRIRKTIELNQIPNENPGVYLIEILGGGISSRIIIKKGSLNLISRNTSKGILCQIINEKNEVLKDNNTYLWYNDIKFTCEKKEGLIILPYQILVDSNNKCILVHDSYADITEIKRKTENYQLKSYFHFLNESIIPGNMLKVNFKTLLFVNRRETSVEQIKNGTIIVEMTKSENEEILPISTIFENIEFKDDNKDYEFEVLIPPMMNQMKFIFKCEIINNSTGEKQSLSYEQNSNFESSNNLMYIPLFHKVGKVYIYEIIGRNGENITAKSGTVATVTINTNYYLNSVDINLQYDKQGKLNLGELKNVETIRIDGNTYYLNENTKYCYPERVDIIQGESFTLPIHSNNKISLDNNDYFQLYEYYSSKDDPSSLIDINKEMKLKHLDINGDKGYYYKFNLGKTLPIGKYYLSFGENKMNNIIVKVKEGKHWMNLENYIINDKGFIENSQIKTPIYMEKLSINKEKGEIEFECANTKRGIQYIHANIYLYQYQNPDINEYYNKYWNMLNAGKENLISCKYSQWENIYLSNRELNEEIEYTIQRKNNGNQLGNSLQAPSLLLKRTYIKDCKNEEENLQKGNEYANVNANMGKGRTGAKIVGKSELSKNMNTDFYNFLKYSGFSLNNITPKNINSNDKNAIFEIKFKDKDILKKYSYIQIILIDNQSIASDLHCLCEDNDTFEIEKRNITNEKAFDYNINLTEMKKTQLIKKGETFNINEITNFKLIDSIQTLSKFYLLTLDKKNIYWDKYKFILNLDNFNEEEFIKNYNEVCGHEINLFLYFKYPKLFNKYIKNNLKYKFEKTFIDYFLLDDYETLFQYLKPLKIKLLPTDELCLLMLKIINKLPDEAKKLRDIIKSRVKKVEDIENILLTNFNIMMNMRVEKEDSLENTLKNTIQRAPPDLEDELKCLKLKKVEVQDSGKNFLQNALSRAIKNRRTNLHMHDDEDDDDEDDWDDSDSDTKQVDFKKQEKTNEFNMALNNAKKEMGAEYEKKGIAKEYKERHYYIKEHKDLNIENPLWLDFAEHILKYKSNENFLSKYVLYNNIKFNEYLFILSIIDIPVESLKHEYKKVPNSRLISINPGSNLILFTKELTETKSDINNKLLISQNVIDEVHLDSNIDTNKCAIGIKYSHQTIITNISNKKILFQLFILIPQGAICLNSTYYINSIKMSLNPYETKNYKIYFYFPNVGKFQQYHPLAYQNGKIISIGNSLTYNVNKKYIPLKKEIIENNNNSKDLRIEGKLRNILSDEKLDNKNKMNDILNYFNNDIFNDEDINNVLYLLKNNKDFYIKLISALRYRGYYNNKVWSFSFHHKDEKGIKEYLSQQEDLINDLGYDFKSFLYSYDEIYDAKFQPHLEYSPLYNARKHPFGNKGNNYEMDIANNEFRETYYQFIIDLLSFQKITIKEKLKLIYYLILQDRMEEALNLFKNIKNEELEIGKNKSYKIQYDYINAYLDCCFGYPEFKIAKSLCKKYRDFPLENWREKFEEIKDQLFEYEKNDKIYMNNNNIIANSSDNKKSLIKELKEKEPKISFNINKDERKITLIHSNVNKIDIQLYIIDLETMFTRNPKIAELMNKDENNLNENIEYFGFVKPNYTETIEIPKENINNNDNIILYKIPKEFRNKNLFIEIKVESMKLFDICLSSNLVVVITESLGELKVIDNNLQSVIKAYVKVYVEIKDTNEVQFYKDGYTDLNGKFNYLVLNTDQLKKAKKFYIFVSEEKQGATVKECYPPKNIKDISYDDNFLGDLQKYKQNQRNQWRLMNQFED